MMSLVKIAEGHVIAVPATNKIRDIVRWLTNQNLILGKDYSYLGVEGNSSSTQPATKSYFNFGFQDPNHALLFKLTWGGE